MTKVLQLTYEELMLITRDNLSDRFEILENDIPKEGHSSQYVEDDGRQYRQFEFKDTQTGETYSFSYVYHRDHQTEFPWSFLGNPPDNIKFVKDSILFPKPVPVVKEKVLSVKEQEIKKLKEELDAIPAQELRPMSPAVVEEITEEVLNNILKFLKSEKFNLLDLRAKLYPICIKHKISHQALWTWLQVKRGVWKA